MKLSEWMLKYQRVNEYPDLVMTQDWALRAAKLEAENTRLLEMLDAAYCLRFVDDTASRQQEMEFWTEVEKTIAKE